MVEQSFFKRAEHGLEGIVLKLASSRYRSGRTKSWLKIKCFTESAFVIIAPRVIVRQGHRWLCWRELKSND
jgi:ATP-dependent DNA ligase